MHVHIILCGCVFLALDFGFEMHSLISFFHYRTDILSRMNLLHFIHAKYVNFNDSFFILSLFVTKASFKLSLFLSNIRLDRINVNYFIFMFLYNQNIHCNNDCLN